MKKIKKLALTLLGSMILMAVTMISYAAGTGNSMAYDFAISTNSAGYSSAPVNKSGDAEAAYATVTENISGWFKKTAFIVVKSTGPQISNEKTLSGAGYVAPVYYDTGKNYYGDVCLRANATFNVTSIYHASGIFYPMGS